MFLTPVRRRRLLNGSVIVLAIGADVAGFVLGAHAWINIIVLIIGLLLVAGVGAMILYIEYGRHRS